MNASDLMFCCGERPELFSKNPTDGSEPWQVQCKICKRIIKKHHMQYAIGRWNTEMQEVENKIATKSW